MIRDLQSGDSESVLRLFQLGIDTENATFETECPSWEDWNSGHYCHSRFVWEENGEIVGWVALGPTSKRHAYRGVAELSIYIDPSWSGKGIGTALMYACITSSENQGIWTLYSSVFPENEATIALHEKFKFRVIGHRERIAQLNGKWRDTILMERRSTLVG